MTKALRMVMVMMIAGCGPTMAQQRPASQPQAVNRQLIVPMADHHVHLLGPYALPMPDTFPSPITLPEGIARLLEHRARMAGNVKQQSDLDSVFTADARLLDAYINHNGWMRDRYWFMRYLNLAAPNRPRRYLAHTFHAEARSGYVAGTVLDVPSGSHMENFLLTVRLGDDDRWRISTESSTPTTPPRYSQPITAQRLIADLDEAGIKYGVVLSAGYWLGSPTSQTATRRMTPVADAQRSVQMENDWTAKEVAKYPDRLVMACGINPLLDFAVAEVIRCDGLPQVIGVKLNLGDSNVDFGDADDMAKVRRVFEAANSRGLALIVHVEPGKFYGPAEVEQFLGTLAAAAPDVVIQLAHLAGNGPGITSPEALEAFAKAVERGDPRTKNLYFDFAGLVYAGMSAEQGAVMAQRMRQIGLHRILYASDETPGTQGNAATHVHWNETRRRLPLTDAELQIVANNVAPYIRKK